MEQHHNYTPRGFHVFCCFYDCRYKYLNNPYRIRHFLKKAITSAGMHYVKSTWQTYKPQGVSLTSYITESSINISTYPEHNFLGMQVWSCGEKVDIKKFIKSIRKILRPKRIIQEKIFIVRF